MIHIEQTVCVYVCCVLWFVCLFLMFTLSALCMCSDYLVVILTLFYFTG